MDDLNHQAGSARLLNMPGRRDQMLRTMLLCALTAAVFFLPSVFYDRRAKREESLTYTILRLF